jgi:hypothetical protein
MQQRQLRLGDILDDYCPRERRLTNHAVVAMVGPDVKQVRCTTCDTEHEFKHAKVPRQRRKSDEPAALYAQVLAGGPKRVAPGAPVADVADVADTHADDAAESVGSAAPLPPRAESTGLGEALSAADAVMAGADASDGPDEPEDVGVVEEGPAHRRLIRATLPRLEGQPPPTRPAPDFTIRQPSGRPGRFRPRQPQAGPSPSTMFGNRSNGNTGGFMRGGAQRQDGGRPQGHGPNRHHAGRKRSK